MYSEGQVKNRYKSFKAEDGRGIYIHGTYSKVFHIDGEMYTIAYDECMEVIRVLNAGKVTEFNVKGEFKDIIEFDEYIDGYFEDDERIEIFLDKVKGEDKNV